MRNKTDAERPRGIAFLPVWVLPATKHPRTAFSCADDAGVIAFVRMVRKANEAAPMAVAFSGKPEIVLATSSAKIAR